MMGSYYGTSSSEREALVKTSRSGRKSTEWPAEVGAGLLLSSTHNERLAVGFVPDAEVAIRKSGRSRWSQEAQQVMRRRAKKAKRVSDEMRGGT